MLLRDVFEEQSESTSDASNPEEPAESPAAVATGTLGKGWAKEGKEKIGIVIDESVLQFYKKTRYGMVPSGLPQPLEEWTVMEAIREYTYEEKDLKIYLIFQ